MDEKRKFIKIELWKLRTENRWMDGWKTTGSYDYSDI